MRTKTAFLAVALTALLAGCGDNAPMLVSQDDEIAIGQQVAQQAIQQYGPPLQSGPEVARVQQVGRRLLQYTHRNVPYSINVLDNTQEVNAFAAPGGPVFVLQPLVRLESADDELAFVMAHEINHIELEHGRKTINQELMVSTAASVVLQNRSQLEQVGAQIAWTLFSQGYSREHETQADEAGLRMMAHAGYNPNGALTALQKLGGGQLSGPAKWLASHPSTPDRIQHLRQMIQSGNL